LATGRIGRYYPEMVYLIYFIPFLALGLFIYFTAQPLTLKIVNLASLSAIAAYLCSAGPALSLSRRVLVGFYIFLYFAFLGGLIYYSIFMPRHVKWIVAAKASPIYEAPFLTAVGLELDVTFDNRWTDYFHGSRPAMRLIMPQGRIDLFGREPEGAPVAADASRKVFYYYLSPYLMLTGKKSCFNASTRKALDSASNATAPNLSITWNLRSRHSGRVSPIRFGDQLNDILTRNGTIPSIADELMRTASDLRPDSLARYGYDVCGQKEGLICLCKNAGGKMNETEQRSSP
jgi:hypothetical protein